MHRLALPLSLLAALALACEDTPPGLPDAATAEPDAARADDATSPADDATPAPDATTAPGCAAPPHVAACDDTLCLIPAGCFLMGSPLTEPCRDESEVQHEVTLTHDFLLSRTEVSRADFRALMGYETYGLLQDHPVVQITWHEAAAYANARSDREGLARCYTCAGGGPQVRCAPDFTPIYDCPGYRHPTDAEWEYAHRAGGGEALYSGAITSTTCGRDDHADAIAWYGNWLGALHAPAGRAPNAWGLYDMSGNAFEWTFDRATTLTATPAVDPAAPLRAPDDEAVMRSGDYGSPLFFVRAASRLSFRASEPLFSLGMRVARTLPAGAPRPSGVPDGGVTDGAVPAACTPDVLPMPIQGPDGPRVHVPLDFEGRPQLLLIDTGSSITTFYLAPDTPPVAPGVGLVTLGCEQVPFYGRNVRAGQVVRGLPVLGALGSDWIVARPTALDLATETVVRWASADEIPDRASLARLPFRDRRGLMLAEARIDGTPVRLLLDTGTPRTLWLGPPGAAGDTVVRLEGETGEIITVREGPASVELAGEPAFTERIWRTADGGSIGAYLRSLGPDVVGILGLASLGTRRVYFGVEPEVVLLGGR